MGPAITGYVNKVNEKGQKFISPHEPDASIMRWAFEQLATGNWYLDQVWRAAKEKGLSCGRKNFWQIIRNPVYCGKIFVPKYKGEEAHVVMGQHEGLISESLFNEVMAVLDGRKKVNKNKIASPDQLPLRGFLICPRCGYMLTGSASKGCTRYYHYYHCFAKCGVRFNAKIVNQKFEEFIAEYTIDPALCDLYKTLIVEVYEEMVGQEKSDIKLYKKQLSDFTAKIEKGRDLLLKGDLDSADYNNKK